MHMTKGKADDMQPTLCLLRLGEVIVTMSLLASSG
jgi:hypothetical protein